jgi:hypothetical protein
MNVDFLVRQRLTCPLFRSVTVLDGNDVKTLLIFKIGQKLSKNAYKIFPQNGSFVY